MIVFIYILNHFTDKHLFKIKYNIKITLPFEFKLYDAILISIGLLIFILFIITQSRLFASITSMMPSFIVYLFFPLIKLIFTIKKFYLPLLTMFYIMIPIAIPFAIYSAQDTYKDTSSEIFISGNSYFVMRSFNSGFLLRVPNKNELVFLTTSGVKISFKQPEGFQNRISPKVNWL